MSPASRSDLRPAACIALVVALAACHEKPPPPGLPPPRAQPDGFESDGALSGWTVTETNPDDNLATWEVAEDAGSPEGRRVMRVRASNEGLTFNVLLSKESHGPDVDVSVSLRADSGQEDQGGGLLWRAGGEEDYYVARWNPLEGNLRAYKVVGGKRRQLAGVTLEADPAAWHQLRASMQGARIRVWFDGQPQLEFEDTTFTEGGRVGLWTKADAGVSFDAFLVEGLADDGR
jgi:hypothetical protein